MTLKYEENPENIIKRLTTAHDPFLAKIRKVLFEQEYRFFDTNIRDSLVLVAGSGLGHDSFKLAKYNLFVTGIEILGKAVEISKERQKKRGIKNINFYEGDFTDEDFMRKFENNHFDSSVLNMGTIGNFENMAQIIKGLSRVSKVFYFDFYHPGEKCLEIRRKMYAEEGWENPQIVEGKIISSDGLDSRCISIEELEGIAKQVNLKISFQQICDFATIARVTQK